MTDTANLNLPLLSPSQAQKHVTVNEALGRLDGLVQLRLSSLSQSTPPVTPVEGVGYGIPAGASGDWTGHDGEVAHLVNGGWMFCQPARGWRALILDQGVEAIHDGSDWRLGAVSLSAGGASINLLSEELDVSISTSPETTALAFPERSLVLGVSGLVTSALSGTASSWRCGDAASDDRFGSGLGMSQNSWLNGPSAPFVVWSSTPVVITGEGGGLTSGSIRLNIHYMSLTSPDDV